MKIPYGDGASVLSLATTLYVSHVTASTMRTVAGAMRSEFAERLKPHDNYELSEQCLRDAEAFYWSTREFEKTSIETIEEATARLIKEGKLDAHGNQIFSGPVYNPNTGRMEPLHPEVIAVVEEGKS